MEQQRRFVLFIVVSVCILLSWQMFVVPLFVKEPVPRRPAPEVVEPDAKPDKAEMEPPAVAAEEPEPAEAEPPAPADDVQRPEYPQKTIVLGSLDPKSATNYLRVTLNTRGAAVEQIELNDERYKELDDPQVPLKVVGHDPNLDLKTLTVAIPELDQKFRDFDLRTINWDVAEQTPTSVTFRLPTPDGTLELLKRFELREVPPDLASRSDARDLATVGYEMAFDFTIRNRSDQPQKLTYTLQGPVGLPLENIETTQKFRDIRMGYVQEGSDEVEAKSVSAKALAESDGKDQKVVWEDRIRFVGIDVQYFAALLIPQEDPKQEPFLESAEPQLVRKDPEPSRSDISVRLVSKPITIPPGQSVSHDYLLYAGPKREVLLEPIGAEGIADMGWWIIAPIASLMLWLLNGLHWLGINYGIAIVILTIIVRGGLFPLSKRQAQNVQKMKDIQPEIAKLKEKFGNDKEAFARAQMELFSKHNYNPFSGCLPIFLQMPIFFGLYRALSVSIDLRRASFLYIDNLAAPDQLFPLGFAVPYFGWTYFNLLPVLTIVLFIFQQKMFMPPPTDEQTAMQAKMMTWMMVIMGVLFYQVPAGLCIYFITSSLWGLGERKMLDYLQKKYPTSTVVAAEKPKKRSAVASFWQRMQEAADAAANSRVTPTSTDRTSERSPKDRKPYRPKR